MVQAVQTGFVHGGSSLVVISMNLTVRLIDEHPPDSPATRKSNETIAEATISERSLFAFLFTAGLLLSVLLGRGFDRLPVVAQG
jgi:hypothetical protein